MNNTFQAGLAVALALFLAVPVSAADEHLTLKTGQEVVVDLRDGRQLRGKAGPLIDDGFNIFPSSGRPKFAWKREIVEIRDAVTGAAVDLPMPKKMSAGTKGLITAGIVGGIFLLLWAGFHNQR
jgi:hypothetical protein